jgi:hypothetical protein
MWMKALAADKNQISPLPDADLIWIEAESGRRDPRRKALLEGIDVAALVLCASFAMREWAMLSAMAGLTVIVLTLLLWPVFIED